MAALAGALRADVEANVATFRRNMDAAGSSVDKLGGKFQKSQGGIAAANKSLGAFTVSMRGAATAAATFAIGAFVADAVKGAMAEEQLGVRLERMFGDAAEGVQDWASETSDALGVVDDALKESAFSFGKFFESVARDRGESVALSEQFAELSVDLARFNGIATSEASDALAKGLAGSTRGLKALGIVISEAEVKQRALTIARERGISATSTEAKTLARANLIWEKTAEIQGFAARNTNTATAQFERFQKSLDDASDSVGAALLPGLTALLQVINELAQAWNDMWANAGNELGLLAARLQFGNDRVDEALRLIAEEKAAREAAAAATRAQGGALEDLSDAEDAAKMTSAEVAQSAAELQRRVTALAGGLGPLQDELDGITSEGSDLAIAIEKQIRTLQKEENQTEATAAAIATLRQALEDLGPARDAATQSAIRQFDAQQNLLNQQNQEALADIQARTRDLGRASGAAGVASARTRQAMDLEDELARERIQNATAIADLNARMAAAQASADVEEQDRLERLIARHTEYGALLDATSAKQLQAQIELEEAIGQAHDATSGAIKDLGTGLIAAAGGQSFDFNAWGTQFVANLADAALDAPAEQLTDALFDFLGIGQKEQDVQTINAAVLNVGPGGAAGLAGSVAGLFGGDSGAGKLISGVGSFFSSFMGPHADGGFIPPGKWGTAGEEGVEPIFGGRHGATVFPADNDRGGDTIVNIQTDNRDSFRASQRQVARETRRAIGQR